MRVPGAKSSLGLPGTVTRPGFVPRLAAQMVTVERQGVAKGRSSTPFRHSLVDWHDALKRAGHRDRASEKELSSSDEAQAAARQGRRACSEQLAADNLVQPFNDMSKLFGINTADLLANTLSRKGTNLTDLYPRSLR